MITYAFKSILVFKILLVFSLLAHGESTPKNINSPSPIWLDSKTKRLDSAFIKLKARTWQLSKNSTVFFHQELLEPSKANSPIVFVEWASIKKFDANWLWETLDEVAQGGEWYELNNKTPKALKPYIDPKATQHWVSYSQNKWGFLSELKTTKRGASLRIIPLDMDIEFSKTKLVPSPKQFPQEDFIGNDFTNCYNKGRCKLAHIAEPNLEVSTGNGLLLKVEYHRQQPNPFSFPPNCLEIDKGQRVEFVDGLKLFVNFELESAFRALVQPLGDFWNWYPWDWRNAQKEYSPTEKELEFYALQCVLPSSINLWSSKPKNTSLTIHNDLRGKTVLELRKN